MACPVCGGTQREAVALGYWRCTSSVAETSERWVPNDPADPARGMHPVEDVTYRTCGTQYQDTTGVPGSGALPQCRCGMFAVGTCQECGQFFCGNHSSLVGGRLLCTPHAQAAARARAAQQQAEEKARAAAPPPPRAPASLQAQVDAARRAEDTKAAATARAAKATEERIQAWATQTAEAVKTTIAELLEMPSPAFCTYQCYGEPRKRRRGPTQVPDELAFGEHLRDELRQPPAGFVPVSTYGRVWPILGWFEGTAYLGHHDESESAVIGSLFVNAAGFVTAGRGRVATTPAAQFWYSGWSTPKDEQTPGSPPPYTYRAAKYTLNIGTGAIRQKHYTHLTAGDFVELCRRARGKPVVVREPLAAIVAGKAPKPQYA